MPRALQEVNRLAPGDIGYLALLAKQWSDLTFYHDVTTDRERQLVNLKALEYADKVGRQGSGCLGGRAGGWVDWWVGGWGAEGGLRSMQTRWGGWGRVGWVGEGVGGGGGMGS